MWNPNHWPVQLWASITLSLDGSIFTIVDPDLQDWVRERGPWCLYDRQTKQYARRTRRRREWDTPGHGATIYLHQWLAEEFIGPPPSTKHILVDHKNGNGLDNRLSNLAWATPQQNRLNLYGMWWAQKDFVRELEEGRDWKNEPFAFTPRK